MSNTYTRKPLVLSRKEFDLIMFALANTKSASIPGGMRHQASIDRVWRRVNDNCRQVSIDYADMFEKLVKEAE